jgi:micrococcal nuclease
MPQGETMSENEFSKDPLAQRILLVVFVFQIVLFPLAVIFSFTALSPLSCIMIPFLWFLIVAVLGWLYYRYQSHPLVRKKKDLMRQSNALSAKIKTEDAKIKHAEQQRDDLARAQQTEISETLQLLQNQHIEAGLRAASIADKQILGIGPKFKERLAAHRILTAADVSKDALSAVEGFGEIKKQTMLLWRRVVEAQVNSAKPTTLPSETLNRILERYQQSRNANDEMERQASNIRSSLLVELQQLAPDLEKIPEITFINYLSQIFSEQKRTSGAFAAIFIVIQVFLVMGTFAGMNISSEPSSTPLPTADYNLMLTKAYETALASIPTNTPQPLPTKTLPPSITPTIIAEFTPTALGVLSTPTRSAPPQTCIRTQEPQHAKVVEIVDGDTIRVIVDGVEKPVRYIGIDTPESTTQVEYFGKEASEKNVELVAGQDIVMYRDVSETDKFDRLLRYVFVGDKFINYELVNQGYAASFRYDPDTSCADLFDQAESNAKSIGLGLWAATATQAAFSAQSPSGGSLEIVAVNKQAEYVDIKNGSSSPVDLTGWILVSEKGSQTCGLGGSIQPGQTLRVWAASGEGFSCNFGKNIWNNSEPDPAVLYNPQHAEISRYP